MPPLLRLMRPAHWIKNLLVFLPIIFHGALLQLSLIFPLFLGFVAFCLVSSCVYIVNDYLDMAKDRHHSTKSKRPLASGAASVHSAAVLLGVLLCACVLVMLPLVLRVGPWPLATIAVYLAINIFYSCYGKTRPILDVFLLMLGYLLRLLMGSLATGIPVSSWMYLTVMSGAFYLGFGKRRNELLHEEDTRSVLKSYTRGFLDMAMYLCLALTMVFYCLWCVNTAQLLLLSVPLLMAICLTYSLNIEKTAEGDPIEVILQSKGLLLLICLLAAFLLGMLYIK